MVPVTQKRVRSVSRKSREKRLSRSPPVSAHERHFSRIHAASPAGESLSAYASVCGLVDWIEE
jgi:hypothetical protein